LDGRLTAPAKVKQIATTGKNTWLEITINEGRNRQIRRMCAKIGHPVMKLKRVRYGPVPLGNLKPGSYRTLSRQEIAGLYQYCRKADKNP
jgi:pseudouridine synthase